MASFSCVLYIHATPEEVWNGIIDPKLTTRYWFHENVSDWEPGSEWLHRQTGEEGTIDILGEVIESDYPNRLVLSWAKPEDAEDPSQVSRVAFEISPQDEWPLGPWTGVQLVHSELEPDSEMLHSISFGWPAVLSGLKSILEKPDIFGVE